jgi:DNA-binding PadR family transcriptional regulator
MIIIPAYAAILILGKLLTIIFIQWRYRVDLHRKKVIHAIVWKFTIGQEATGLEIMNTFRTLWDIEPPWGVTYSVLHMLENAGLLAGRWGEATPERGNRRKRYYRMAKQKRREA